jgi:hypothetical protein
MGKVDKYFGSQIFFLRFHVPWTKLHQNCIIMCCSGMCSCAAAAARLRAFLASIYRLSTGIFIISKRVYGINPQSFWILLYSRLVTIDEDITRPFIVLTIFANSAEGPLIFV